MITYQIEVTTHGEFHVWKLIDGKFSEVIHTCYSIDQAEEIRDYFTAHRSV